MFRRFVQSGRAKVEVPGSEVVNFSRGVLSDKIMSDDDNDGQKFPGQIGWF